MSDTERSPAIQRAIVTGGNGFIGSSLIAALLRAGTQVHALVNENHQKLDKLLPAQNIHVLQETAQNAVGYVLDIKPDVVFHLAAVYAEPDDVEGMARMIQGNLTLGTFLLYGCTHLQPRPVFINTGTYWQFAPDGTFDPNTLYAATKQAFQDILVFYHRRLDVRSVSLALYDTFGETDSRRKLWQRIAESAPGTHIPLSIGVQELFLTHIDDTITAFLLAAHLLRTQQPLEEIYAVRSAQSFVLRAFLEDINTRSGADLDLGWGELPFWEGQVITPWSGHLLPGWRPRHDPTEALIRMIQNHRARTRNW